MNQQEQYWKGFLNGILIFFDEYNSPIISEKDFSFKLKFTEKNIIILADYGNECSQRLEYPMDKPKKIMKEFIDMLEMVQEYEMLSDDEDTKSDIDKEAWKNHIHEEQNKKINERQNL